VAGIASLNAGILGNLQFKRKEAHHVMGLWLEAVCSSCRSTSQAANYAVQLAKKEKTVAKSHKN